MNNNLTVNSLAFNLNYSDKSGSLRTETARGVNLPTTMQIKHQKFTDSATKLPGTQSALIFAKYKALSDGRIAAAVVVTLKVQVLEDANVNSTDVTETTDLIVGTIQEDDSGLDLADEIFVTKEQ